MRDPYSKNYNTIYRGIVESNEDPKHLGRCRVRVPAIHGDLTYDSNNLPWARSVAPSSVSGGKGSTNLPDKGDIVWVLFEGANKEFPVYIGGTYGTEDLPVDSSNVIFYAENGNSIVYNREGTYTITVGGCSITVDSSSVSITSSTEATVVGDLKIEGNLSVEGNFTVEGTTRVNTLYINGELYSPDN